MADAPTSAEVPQTAFSVGDKVAYPYHGATRIDRVETVEVLGTEREYLVLEYEDLHLTLRVPSDQASSVGLREVIDDGEVADILEVLGRRNVRLPSNWSRRYKNHVEMLKSGDPYQLAEVVRNLSQRQRDKALSAAEKRMLETARRLLVSELCLALSEDSTQIDSRLDAALG